MDKRFLYVLGAVVIVWGVFSFYQSSINSGGPALVAGPVSSSPAARSSAQQKLMARRAVEVSVAAMNCSQIVQKMIDLGCFTNWTSACESGYQAWNTKGCYAATF